jgi:D-3-phosphoglycerate dehydrogenase
MADWNADQVVAILNGERPPRLINPEAWPRYVERYQRVFGKSPQG